MVALGYVSSAPEENANFKEIDGTRYFCTGDIGEVFPDGTLKIIGSSFQIDSFCIQMKISFQIERKI